MGGEFSKVKMILKFLFIIAFLQLVLISSFRFRKLNFNRPRKTLTLNIKIAFTREFEANLPVIEKLKEFECFNLPCIEYLKIQENISLFSAEIHQQNCILLTSPQAANVFVSEAPNFRNPPILASIGKGTTKILESRGFKPAFEPTQALGEVLAYELPIELGPKILYPCSELASNNIQNILQSRGFQFTRINTYKPIAPLWDESKILMASKMDLVTFASPSALKYWKSTIGTNFSVVAIGPTTKDAAIKAGFKNVYSSESSLGLDPWIDLIRSIAGNLKSTNI